MSKLIQIQCRTNLDEYQKEKWPTQLSCRPMIGECIESEGGKVLKIVMITHHKGSSIQYVSSWLELELHNCFDKRSI